ncbi:ribbon-helix-helix domain-containing protein [Pseudodonghicola xiamenensis]|uniref:HTH cro/C1-type domain-containing protein n=1 Tax=Pseudodonghicola xiamenensis TaxID=337702 RepID=A0A8J3H8C2_9RHOB|nr:hypothetical protein [Pseudodonghicola xiamenensis]GHG99761.1 hypothetical protein GCM10010961_35870 [Pseudodonghicola xiamenensis]
MTEQESQADQPQQGQDTGPRRRPGRPRKPQAERRSDQMSIRMKPATREQIEKLADALGVPIAEVVEQAGLQFKP